MLFGLKNSGATFPRMIEDILANVSNVNCYVYDILIFSNCRESYQALRECVRVITRAWTSYPVEEVLIHATTCGTIRALH